MAEDCTNAGEEAAASTVRPRIRIEVGRADRNTGRAILAVIGDQIAGAAGVNSAVFGTAFDLRNPVQFRLIVLCAPHTAGGNDDVLTDNQRGCSRVHDHLIRSRRRDDQRISAVIEEHTACTLHDILAVLRCKFDGEQQPFVMVDCAGLDDRELGQGCAVAIGTGGGAQAIIAVGLAYISGQRYGMAILRAHGVARQISMQPRRAVSIGTHRVQLPAGELLLRYTDDAILFVVIERSDVNGNVVAHGAVLGVVCITVIGSNIEYGLAVDQLPSANAAAAIEGSIVIEVRLCGDGIGAGSGGLAYGIPQAGQSGVGAADAGYAKARLGDRLLHAFQIVGHRLQLPMRRIPCFGAGDVLLCAVQITGIENELTDAIGFLGGILRRNDVAEFLAADQRGGSSFDGYVLDAGNDGLDVVGADILCRGRRSNPVGITAEGHIAVQRVCAGGRMLGIDADLIHEEAGCQAAVEILNGDLRFAALETYLGKRGVANALHQRGTCAASIFAATYAAAEFGFGDVERSLRSDQPVQKLIASRSQVRRKCHVHSPFHLVDSVI